MGQGFGFFCTCPSVRSFFGSLLCRHPQPFHCLALFSLSVNIKGEFQFGVVSPLPQTQLGHQYLLTIRCTATRFPEAVLVCRITASVVTRALIRFFLIQFGLPLAVKTDQSTNFQSRVFKQVLQLLGIKHIVSSAYHPESQDALERWHQTLKTMLRKYCFETGKPWDEGLPFVVFATRMQSRSPWVLVPQH